jgi:hypothetical protein
LKSAHLRRISYGRIGHVRLNGVFYFIPEVQVFIKSTRIMNAKFSIKRNNYLFRFYSIASNDMIQNIVHDSETDAMQEISNFQRWLRNIELKKALKS